jgi:signal transduction histidine kinase
VVDLKKDPLKHSGASLRRGGGEMKQGETPTELVARARQAWLECDAPHELPGKAWAALSMVPLLCSALEERLEYQGIPSPAEDLERFGRTLAHEIRNRVNSGEIALQQLQLLGEGRSERERELLGRVRAAMQGIVALADSVRHLVSAPERVGEPASLVEVATRVADRVRPLAEERGVRLEVARELPEVPVDAGRAELVLSNLLTNAITYLDDGKEERWVRLAARQIEGEGVWCVEVEDNGRGIDGPQQAQVFDLFFRGSGAEEEGSGLGLAIARQAVEQLGGRIWLESQPGKGTTLFFTIPENAS